MKRVAHKILIALVTFAVGVSLSLNWVPQPKTLGYCELVQNAEKHRGREVRVRARLSGDGAHSGYVIYQLECDPIEALASWVTLDEAQTARPEAIELRQKMFAPKLEDTRRQVEVVLRGRFGSEFGTGCWGPKFTISEAAIEQVLSVSEERLPPPSDEMPLRIRH